MKETRSMMDMHVTVEIADRHAKKSDLAAVFNYFTYIDNTFSTFKPTSEISQINAGKIKPKNYSPDMKMVLALCEQTTTETAGFFDMHRDGKIDPTGLVKGWAIWQAAELLKQRGCHHFLVDAGGDIQVAGKNKAGLPWSIGIRNPFDATQIVKVLQLSDCGIATSGTSLRGQHIYNPHQPTAKMEEIVSLTVIGPNVYEADRFATPAFAMEKAGMTFIAKRPGLEAYMIDKNGIATYTPGFTAYCQI